MTLAAPTAPPTGYLVRPPRGTPIVVALLAAAFCGGLGLGLAARGLSTGPSLAGYLSYAVACVLGLFCFGALYLAYAAAALRYIVDRNGLAIQWGTMRVLVPMSDIERIVLGRSLGAPRVRGLNLPGLHVGRGEVRRLGEVCFFSTHRTPDDLLYVVTPDATYGLTVREPARFALEVQRAQEVGPEVQLRHAPVRGFVAALPFWLDRWAQGLMLAAAVAAVLVGIVVYARFNSLPATITVRFPEGSVVRVGSRSAVLAIPVFGAILLVVNAGGALLVRNVSRVMALTLLAATLACELALAIGALNAVR